MRLSALAAAIAISLCSGSIASQEFRDFSKMNRKDFDALSGKEKMLAPAFLAHQRFLKWGRISAAQRRANAVGVASAALNEFRFLRELPSRKETPQLRSAIRNYQKSIAAKSTGILLLGEWITLMARHNKVRPRQIGLHNLRFFEFSGFVSINGTWKPNSEKQLFPLQTSKIECRRELRRCTSATTTIAYSSLVSVVGLTIEDWHITKWTPGEIVAERTYTMCFGYTMTISLRKKSAFMFRRPRAWRGRCKSFRGKPQVFRLVDGRKIQKRYFSRAFKQRRGFYHPEFRKRIERLEGNFPASTGSSGKQKK